jgi:hypothetical protein
MKKSVCFLGALFLICFCVSGQDQVYIETAKNLKEVAETYLNENKPDKITVIFNAYQIVIEKVKDKNKVKAYSDFFARVINENSTAFRSLWISINDSPKVIGAAGGWNHLEVNGLLSAAAIPNKNPKGGWTHTDIKNLLEAIDYGVSPADITVEKLGSIRDLNVTALKNMPRSGNR